MTPNATHISGTDVGRAWDNLKRIDREYGTGVTRGEFATRVYHDLGVMARHGDLKQLGVELHDPHKAVLMRYVQTLPVGPTGLCGTPQIDPTRVAKGRLLVRGGRYVADYRRELALDWRSTGKTAEPPADAFATGPNEQVRVGAVCRKTLVVLRAGAQGYAFGEVIGEPGKSVFLHRQQAAPDVAFHVGQRLTAVVVRVPAAGHNRHSTDLQAWAIRVA